MAKIIIADDNKDLNNMLSEYLGSQNNLYVDKTFTTGKQVLSYLENNYADVLLLDIFMPDVDGISVLEELSNSFEGVSQAYAIQAGREVRVMVKPEQINDAETLFLAKEIAKKIEQEMEYPGQIKVNVIREWRATEFAK